MRRILYLIQKEFRQVFREKANIGIIFIMPFIQLVVLGFAITVDITNIPVAVVDDDHSALSRSIATALDISTSFDYRGTVPSIAAAVRAIDYGIIKIAVVLPVGLEEDAYSGKQPAIQVLIDGVDGNAAGIAVGYVKGLLTGIQQKESVRLATLPAVVPLYRSVSAEPRFLYNENLESVRNIVPGIIAVLLTMITLFLSAINLVREKEIGTLEQLIVTPIRGYELIIGKIIPFAILGFVLFNVGILAAGLIFGIWIKGSLLLLYGLCTLYMFSTLGLGIFISTISRTQQQAMFFAWFFAILSILLSGFFIPIQNMPEAIQLLTYANPIRYFMAITRAIYLKGASFEELIPDVTGMTVFGAIVFVFAVMRFKKRAA